MKDSFLQRNYTITKWVILQNCLWINWTLKKFYNFIPAKRTPRPAEGRPWRGASEASGACAKRFYSFSCKKKVPYMDQNEKKIFPFLNLTLTFNKRSTMKKKYAPWSICHPLGIKWKKNIPLNQYVNHKG